MKNIVLQDATPLGVIDFANEVWNGGFDDHAELMYKKLSVYTEASGRFRCVAEIEVECEGYTIEVVDRPWFEGCYQPGESGSSIDEIGKFEDRDRYKPFIDIGKLDGSGNERWVEFGLAVTLGQLESEEQC